ncbi:MAG: N-acetyl-gamma-glutamyl-phosphate reductase, partial [Anaerolineae bacterium]|nr:N-acetyl-gamma-glutamyl-phosphate reductase [Anaerolineae bacterium]
LVPGAPLIVDAKSGASGAGRTPKTNTLFCEVHGNFSPYKIGRTHQHLGEMDQQLAKAGSKAGPLIFSPHLLPTDRGILATVYAQVTDLDAAQAAFDLYADEPLVKVLPPGQLAALAHVVRTPYTAISLTPTTAGNVLIVTAVIDNLLKGAASQAVQNFNLMWNFPETAGLI